MLPLLNSQRTLSRLTRWLPLAHDRTGWIGVDLGARMIKLAQLEKTGSGWRLAGRWTIGDDDDPPLTKELYASGFLSDIGDQLGSARRMFHGRLAAVALPPTTVELRALEVPTGPAAEVRCMVEQEVSADWTGGDFAFDWWPTHAGGELTKLIAVAADHDLVSRVSGDLRHVGFDCPAMDVTACAVARAVALCDPASNSEPVAALDVGYSTALLTIVGGGKPIFSRALRDCGLHSLCEPLRAQLNIGGLECRQLLTRYGVSEGGAPEAGVAAVSIGQTVARPLEKLAQEIERTLRFAVHQFRAAPLRCWLMGGGGTVRNLAGYLSQRTGLPTHNWTLAPGAADPSSEEPLFAVAAGLSALAWEANLCT